MNVPVNRVFGYFDRMKQPKIETDLVKEKASPPKDRYPLVAAVIEQAIDESEYDAAIAKFQAQPLG
jgi:hypothetical protein